MIRSLSLSVAQRYLEPGESLAEVLFGLIMTLTFTLAAGLLVREGTDAVRELLIAIVGCNIAWGVIDAALYLSGRRFERARLARVGADIRRAETEQDAVAVVERELGELIGAGGDVGDRVDLLQRTARYVRASVPRPHGVTRADLHGAIASFWLVFFASIPAAVPFLFIDNARTALRVSNGVLILLLFLTGYRWAPYAALPPWRTGLLLMIGLALVLMAIALGG